MLFEMCQIFLPHLIDSPHSLNIINEFLSILYMCIHTLFKNFKLYCTMCKHEKLSVAQ